MLDLAFSTLKYCTKCSGDLLVADDFFTCEKCGSTFGMTPCGIWDFRDTTSDNAEPKFFDEPEFKRWLSIFRKTESKNWVIYKNALFRFIAQSGHRLIGERVKAAQGKDALVLEIGAGTGSLLKFCDSKNFVALDTSMESLEVLKEKWPQATCICTSSARLPFAGNSFDQVVSLHTLEHLYFLAESLQEMSRVQKTDGLMHYVIPTEGGLAFLLGRKFITGPHLRRQYDLDVDYVMAREHINDAPRVIKFLKFYYDDVENRFWPLPFLRLLSLNSMIYGTCKGPRLKE